MQVGSVLINQTEKTLSTEYLTRIITNTIYLQSSAIILCKSIITYEIWVNINSSIHIHQIY